MPIQIVLHTPTWVWGVFSLLLVLGWSQSRPRSVGFARTALMPLAMAGFSAYGTVSAFGATPQVLAGWCAAALALAWAVSRTALPGGTRYDAGARRFTVGGSWVPLALMMGVFCIKYAVGVTLAMVPERTHDAGFAIAAALLYGAFTGCFFGRAARLWRLAAVRGAPASDALAA